MLHEDLIKFYSSIEINVNPHVEAGVGMDVYLDSNETDITTYLFSVLRHELQYVLHERNQEIYNYNKLVTALVVTKDGRTLTTASHCFDGIQRDLWMLKIRTDEASGISEPEWTEDFITSFSPEEDSRFISVTFRINPHKASGLTIEDYIQDHDGKGFDDSYVCEDNYFSDDPTYELELNLCSAANRLYTTTAYWKDDSGNQMCHDAFAHDYATILKELREITDDRNNTGGSKVWNQ